MVCPPVRGNPRALAFTPISVDLAQYEAVCAKFAISGKGGINMDKRAKLEEHRGAFLKNSLTIEQLSCRNTT